MKNKILIIKDTICTKITTKQNWPLATIAGSLHEKFEENFRGIFAIYAFDLEWGGEIATQLLPFEVWNMCSLKY